MVGLLSAGDGHCPIRWIIIGQNSAGVYLEKLGPDRHGYPRFRDPEKDLSLLTLSTRQAIVG